jgi:aminopeptidase N
MKKIKLLPMLLCMSFAAFSQNTPMTDFEKIVQGEQRAHRYITNSLVSLSGNNYDIKYNRCEWTVNPAVNYISGAITTYFTSNVASLSQIVFDLSTALTVDSVKYQASNLSFLQVAGNGLQINLPAPLSLNALDSITVYYRGVPPSTGFGSFNQDTHNSFPIIWTLSEPFGASDWWPCKNSLIDKVDSIDIIVTTPQAYRVASNGLLISEVTSGSNKIYHWQSHYPIASYLIAIAVTNYAVYSNYVPIGSDSINVLNYVYPENLATAQSETPSIIPIMQLYDSLTIPYPFTDEKYGHAQFGWGGGMEHQTMSFMVNFGYSLMAHECAHQWFGDKVTCGSWEDIWLNEGFATYMEGLTVQRYFPGNWSGWKSSKISNIASQPDGSVMCDDTTSVNRIFSGRLSYNKGSYVLHMLRWKLGDTDFFQSLRNYLNDPLLAYNFAKTPDLKYHLENTSGMNLTNFFNDWYYNQGYPSYQVRWNKVGSNLIVKLDQSQSHASVSFFEMPVPVHFQGPGLDTILVFDHTSSGQIFNTVLIQNISTVTFDPDLWILSANNTVVHDLTLSTNDVEEAGISVEVCPNPFSSVISVKGTRQKGEVILYDVAGKEILRQKASEAETQFNTSNIAAGLYQLTYMELGAAKSIKLVKSAD